MPMLNISPSSLAGKVFIPPSKSHTMRALIFGSLGEGKTVIHHYLQSPDVFSMIEALRAFGAEIEVKNTTIEINGLNGQLQACNQVIDAGNSGQVLRFIGSLSALLPSYTVITGDHSIRHSRPIQPLLSALAQLKAFAVSIGQDGRAPVFIQGPMQIGNATLCGEDSQPVSGLLIATSFLDGTTHLTIKNPGETPWIDLTLAWLRRMGGQISHQNYEHYTITGPLRYKGFKTAIPGDFSSSAFPLIAALITQSALTVENIDMKEIQGDKKIIPLLTQMGACFDIDTLKKTVTVCKGGHLTGMTIDANEIIDAIPILAVLGCFASGKTEIINAAIARKKESDRLHAITLELRKMGAQIEEMPDGLVITPAPLQGAFLNSHNDHRIAMALIVAALAASGDSCLEGAECIAKSYPSFISDFQKIGARIV